MELQKENKVIYHREKPVRKFDLNQTLYTTVVEQNKHDMVVQLVIVDVEIDRY